ncbi:hypothetical protein EDB19DRAFT_633869 [Suillus lakei]|nr:hypothetical protein EDB19DRAFT_633869 [Suillus lakei]
MSCSAKYIQKLERESSAQCARLVSERYTLLDKLEAADAQLVDVKREAGSYCERFAETRTSLKVLQERFDDQSVTLRLTKESVGEAQSTNNTILVAWTPMSYPPVHLLRDIGSERKPSGIERPRQCF